EDVEHVLRRGLGRRQHPGPQPGHRQHRLANPFRHPILPAKSVACLIAWFAEPRALQGRSEPSAHAPLGLEEPGLEIHRGCGEKSLRTNDHDFGNSRSRVRVVLLSGDSPPGEQSMNVRIITTVAAAAALALSLSACQKKEEAAAPAADSSATAAAPAAAPAAPA